MALTLKKNTADGPADGAKSKPGLRLGGKGKGGGVDPTASLLTDTLPAFNVISPKVVEAYQVKGVLRKLVYAAVALVLVVVGVWFTQGAQISSAQKDLDSANAQTATANAQIQKLQPVKVLYSTAQQQQALIDSTLQQKVLFSAIFSDLQKAAGPVQIQSANVTYSAQTVAAATKPGQTPAPAASPCGTDPNPFNMAQEVGCVRFSGTAKSRNDLGALITRLDSSSPLFTSAYISSSNTGSPGNVTFTATVALTPKILANPPKDTTKTGAAAQGAGAAAGTTTTTTTSGN